MPVERVKTISQLQETYPFASDPWSEGDDHIRNNKYCLKKQFPGKNGQGFDKAITSTEDELNFSEGLTGNIQEQFDELPNEFVASDGDASIDGTLSVQDTLSIGLDTSGDRLSGMQIFNASGGIHGALYYDDNDTSLNLIQNVVTSTQPDTLVTIQAGNISVTSPAGFSTEPWQPDHLVNKTYADMLAGVTTASLNTAIQDIQDLKSTVLALQNIVNAL